METNKEKETKAQGAEVKKKQATSPTYTLKATNQNVERLLEANLISKEEAETMKEILKKSLARHIGLEL